MSELRALTVRQPWAWAILHGKVVENRSREMKYRGPLWLHAGACSRWDPDGERSPLVREAWVALKRPGVDADKSIRLLRRSTNWMPFSAVVALVNVTGCHHADDCACTCSPWAVPGQWHIEFADPRPLPDPVPCRGALGLWRLPEDVERTVTGQLDVLMPIRPAG